MEVLLDSENIIFHWCAAVDTNNIVLSMFNCNKRRITLDYI